MKTARGSLFTLLIRAWRPIAWLLNPIERRSIARHREKGNDYSPVFVIGPPRCGSTFTYQVLTENFLIEYIDNLDHALHRSLYLGNRVSHVLFNDKPHGNFRSKGGRTLEGGWHAPSECPAFWYRSIPKELHRVVPNDLNREEQAALSDPLHAIMGKNGRPILIKNLLIVERLELIQHLFPNARFIVVERDRLHTARSILRQRKELGIPENEWWSARPRNYPELKELRLEEKVAAQVHYLEKDIRDGLQGIGPEQKTTLRFEELLENPMKTLEELKIGFLKDLEWRNEKLNIPEFKKREEKAMGSELERVRKGFLKLGLPYE